MALLVALQKCIYTLLSLFYGYMVTLGVVLAHIVTGFKYCAKKDYTKRPSVLDDPSLGEHHTTSVNNKIIHYVGKGNPQDKKIVFLHGFPDFWFTWKEQLKEFGSANYYAVAIDLPGCGESSKLLDLQSVTLDRLTQDVAKVIQGLTKDNEKIILVGHDWGGCISYYIAAEYPNLVEKYVVLNGPHPILFKHYFQSDLRQFLRAGYILFFCLPWIPEWAFKSFDFIGLKVSYRRGNWKAIFSDKELRPLKYIFSQLGALTSAINYYRANIPQMDTWTKRENVHSRQPLLLIWGGSEPALVNSIATSVTIYADNARVIFVKGCSHFVHLEKPKYISQLIREFIESS